MFLVRNGKEVRGVCEYCFAWYECGQEPQSGAGCCAKCYRARAGLFNPITPALSFWGCVAADNLHYTRQLRR